MSVKIGAQLQREDCHPCRFEYGPADRHLAMWADDVCGPSAVGLAVLSCLAGRGIERFAVCDREESGPPTVQKIIGFGLATVEGVRCVRWLGEHDDPDGDGSSAVVPSWYGESASEPAIVAAVIACNIRSPWVFRLARGATA